MRNIKEPPYFKRSELNPFFSTEVLRFFYVPSFHPMS